MSREYCSSFAASASLTATYSAASARARHVMVCQGAQALSSLEPPLLERQAQDVYADATVEKAR